MDLQEIKYCQENFSKLPLSEKIKDSAGHKTRQQTSDSYFWSNLFN